MDGERGFEIRRYRDADLSEVLGLLASSLLWTEDPTHADFFRWKHQDNPFGPSLMWVAVKDDSIVGFRALLRWRFRVGSRMYPALRPVDTVTHPRFRRRGVFRHLTAHALGSLEDDSAAFLFNTPDPESLPQYLKLGWRVAQRPLLCARLRLPPRLHHLKRAWTHADQFSQNTPVGESMAEVDNRELSALMDAQNPIKNTRWSTEDSVPFRQWRYGFSSLAYRFLPIEDKGALIFRLRRRGSAVEAVICETHSPGGTSPVRSGVGRLLRLTGADYALTLGPSSLRGGWLPLPKVGPTIVWRPLMADLLDLRFWDPSLGEIELF
jgi:hypothetical protein